MYIYIEYILYIYIEVGNIVCILLLKERLNFTNPYNFRFLQNLLNCFQLETI